MKKSKAPFQNTTWIQLYSFFRGTSLLTNIYLSVYVLYKPQNSSLLYVCLLSAPECLSFSHSAVRQFTRKSKDYFCLSCTLRSYVNSLCYAVGLFLGRQIGHIGSVDCTCFSPSFQHCLKPAGCFHVSLIGCGK